MNGGSEFASERGLCLGGILDLATVSPRLLVVSVGQPDTLSRRNSSLNSSPQIYLAQLHCPPKGGYCHQLHIRNDQLHIRSYQLHLRNHQLHVRGCQLYVPMQLSTLYHIRGNQLHERKYQLCLRRHWR